MESTAAARLASQLSAQRKSLCQHVSARLLRAFPELTSSLRLEENYSATDRLSQVAVERFNELVRAILLFELPSLADKEIYWAQGVLPPRGVTYQHQSAMVRWFFEEVRRLPLSPAELDLTREVEQYFLNLVTNAYNRN
ncbi:MAG: hypothetical protein HGA45_09590 [Chloroflexales bacterium]|nr:hypothetical protein [Chloroflexales bacterium]